MAKLMFITETNKTILKKDFSFLRNLYMPLIGMEATTLYSLLNDYDELNKARPTYNEVEDLAITMNVTSNEIMNYLKKLEATGLVRTFEKANNTNFIFSINAPLNPVEFKKNHTLYNQLVKKIGDIRFERLFFDAKANKVKKDDFVEVTTKYQDVFEIQTEVTNTLEMPAIKFTNKEDAIKGLTSFQFVSFISSNKVTPTQLALFQRLSNSGLSSQSINEIVDYTFEVNGKIVSNHIEVIANDMISKGITNPTDIKTEMNNAKNIGKNAKVTLEDEVRSSVGESELTWNEIFDSLGGEI